TPQRVAGLGGVGLRAGRVGGRVGRVVRRPMIATLVKIARETRFFRAEKRQRRNEQENGSHPTHTDHLSPPKVVDRYGGRLREGGGTVKLMNGLKLAERPPSRARRSRSSRRGRRRFARSVS